MTTHLRVTVATHDLTQALKAVMPHASPEPDDPVLARLRVEVGPVNLTIAATNRFTAGLAVVSVEDNPADEMGSFDLTLENARELLALFKGRPGKDDDPGDLVRLDVNDSHVRATDVSGLFEMGGKSLRVVRVPDADTFPDVPLLVSKRLQGTTDEPMFGAARLLAAGGLLKAFTAAAAAYGEPLLIEQTPQSRSLVVSCGESFLGLMMPISPSEDAERELTEWRDGWLRRLPTPGARAA